MAKNIPILSGGVGDFPDTRDHVVKAPRGRRLKDYVNLLKVAEKQGFKRIKQSKNSCTAYARINLAEMVNAYFGEFAQLDRELQWKLQIENGGTVENGDTLQSSMSVFHKNPQGKPETEYFRIRGAKQLELQRWFSIGYPCMTLIRWKDLYEGSNNYSKMLKTGRYDYDPLKTLGAHAIVIHGYDKKRKVFLCFESLVNEWGEYEIGEFDLPFDLIEKTGSCYISRDSIG